MTTYARSLLGMAKLRFFPMAAAAVTMCASAGLSAAPASATVGRAFSRAITEAPAGSPLIEPEAVGVDGAAGRVFVADLGTGSVDVLTSTGAFVTRLGEGSLFAAGIAVDESSGMVYVADSSKDAVLVFRPSGTDSYSQVAEWSGSLVPGGEFGEVAGVAVDNSAEPTAGVVYVADARNVESEVGAVFAIRPKGAGAGEGAEGALVGTLTDASMESPNGVAVSPATGSVFVADATAGGVYQFSREGVLERKLTGAGSPQGTFLGKLHEEGNVSAVAIDPSSGDLLVAEGERGVVGEFSSAGEWVGWIPSTPEHPFEEPVGVGCAPNGDAFVGNAGRGELDMFGPAAPVPDVATANAAKVTRTSAALQGTVIGTGAPGRYFFQWGSSPALGSTTNAVADTGGEEKVQLPVAELEAGSTYFFRVVAEDEHGVSYGVIREFTTPPAVEAVSTGSVEGLTPASATLRGTLTPGGFDAHYFFQWGSNDSYGHASPELPGGDAGTVSEAVSVGTEITGLSPNSSYHYRLVAINSFGSTYGADASFTTPGPPRIQEEPASQIGHEQATINAVLRAGGLSTSYHLQYGETTAYGGETPGASVGAGETPEAVSVVLSGLMMGTTYHYRVIASNGAGTVYGQDRTLTTLAAANIAYESVTGITSAEATVRGEVNPLGHETTYEVQYGTVSCETGACTSTPAVDVGAGEAEVAVSQQLTGLDADASYHYRIVASNSLGSATGPEQTFTTGSPVLPDGRAWEMVTPSNKHGATVEALTREGGLILASEDGNRLTYVVDGGIGEGQGDRSPEPSQILATREPSGWSTTNITTPNEAEGLAVGAPPEYQYFTPDLSTALVQPLGNPPAPPLAPGVTQATPYLRDNVTASYLPLVTEADVAPGTAFGGLLTFVAATPDLQDVVISSKVALEGQGSAPGLYEWSGGQLQPVSILPDGRAVIGVGSSQLGYANTVANALSSDGSRVVWTTPEVEPHLGHLYMRDTVSSETIQLDAAQGIAQPKGLGEARFQTASSDDSRIFFTDPQRLTADATAGPANPDLYECEVVAENGRSACRLQDLTVDPIPGEHADVQGSLLAVGQSGSDVYLIVHGLLAENENGAGQVAEAGGENLYHLHFDGSSWSTVFIAALSREDEPEWEGNKQANAAFLTARVSPNGRYLAFMSAASPTGYDNVDQNSGRRDEEVYLFDSATLALTCVSCNPSGARPVGVLDRVESGEGLGLLVDRRKIWAEAGREHWLGGNIPGWTADSLEGALIQSRYLTDKGRLFFNSPDHLVPAAANGKENVYEYEPSGVGSCQTSAGGGCISILSSGTSQNESAFLEATPEGSNVFFLTASRLLAQDTDTAYDIYDAHECSPASPCLTPPAPTPRACAEAGTCRPVQPSQPETQAAPGTATNSGPGNITSAPAPTNQVHSSQAKKLTRAQRLARALKVCRKQRNKKKRDNCEAHARRLYGPAPKAAKRSARRAGAGSMRRTTAGVR